MDMDRNGIHDSIQEAVGPVNVGLSFTRAVTDLDRQICYQGVGDSSGAPVVDGLLVLSIPWMHRPVTD